MKFKKFMEAVYAIYAELPKNVELPSEEWFKENVPKEDRKRYLNTAMDELAFFKLTEKLGYSIDEEPEPEDSEATTMPHDDNADAIAHSIDDTLAERRTNYGEFTTHAELSQHLKAAFDNHVREYGQPEKFTNSMNEAIEMVFHKLARIANGDPTYVDSWTDINGYSTLIVKELNGESL